MTATRRQGLFAGFMTAALLVGQSAPQLFPPLYQARAADADQSSTERTPANASPQVRRLEFVESATPIVLRTRPDESIEGRTHAASFEITFQEHGLQPPLLYGNASWRWDWCFPGEAAPLESLVKLVPDSMRPDPDLVSKLVSGSHLYLPVWTRQRNPSDLQSLEHSLVESIRSRLAKPRQIVTGNSPDHAKQLAEALVSILDNGLSREMHEAYEGGVEYLERRIIEHDAEIATFPERMASLQKKLEEQREEDLTDEVMAKLNAERRMIDVKTAGLKAKISHCESILRQQKATGDLPYASQVETIKVSAEIELVGLFGERFAIDGAISAGNRRRTLSKQITQLTHQITDAPDKSQRLRQNRSLFRRALADRWPHFTVGPVSIRPIQWVIGEPAEPPQEPQSAVPQPETSVETAEPARIPGESQMP